MKKLDALDAYWNRIDGIMDRFYAVIRRRIKAEPKAKQALLEGMIKSLKRDQSVPQVILDDN